MGLFGDFLTIQQMARQDSVFAELMTVGAGLKNLLTTRFDAL